MNDLSPLIRARLVWDGSSNVSIPFELGLPAAGQMEGTHTERLSELAGRTCYDSLGRGRSSAAYHQHIKEVGHFSVYEHAHMTVEINEPFDGTACVFLNRPGLWVVLGAHSVRVTFNPRVILDWNAWSEAIQVNDEICRPSSYNIGKVLLYHAQKAYPMIAPPCEWPKDHEAYIVTHSRVVEPQHDEERWVSMFVAGSRGFSHELVRHGDRTAISQRSTRFVDESESEWVMHPLLRAYVQCEDVPEHARAAVVRSVTEVEAPARSCYAHIVRQLEPWLVARGVDKTSARKQARGAARGYLGNALYTELIFSASVAQWKRMIRMRACAAADAEIREDFIKVLGELRQSRYRECFDGFKVSPASDGIGETVAELPGVKV